MCDFFFLGRQLPSTRSWGCLLALLVGACGYVLTDAAYVVRAPPVPGVARASAGGPTQPRAQVATRFAASGIAFSAATRCT